MSTFIRFTLVSLLGVLVDFSISLILSELFFFNLALSAVIGFLFAALLNFSLHNVWTFSSNHLKNEFIINTYVISLFMTILIRLFSIFFLQLLFDEFTNKKFILLIAITFSFSINFLLNRYYVFLK